MTSTPPPRDPENTRSARQKARANRRKKASSEANTTPVRAVIYVRISRDKEGAGLGVERQEGDCRDLVQIVSKQLGRPVHVIETYVDNDMSAYTKKPRKNYLRMLADLRAGRAELVLAWHTDRLHRKPIELEEYITVCQPRGIATYCVKAGQMDLTTPAGRLVARNLGNAGSYEVEHMSERIVAEKLVARSNGEWIGGPRPFGWVGPIKDQYGNVLNRDEVGVVAIPHEIAMIQDGVRRVISGDSLGVIQRDWNTRSKTPQGNDHWDRKSIKMILTRPRNIGLVVYQGEVLEGVKGLWEPIITEEEYHAVRAILLDEGRATHHRSSSLKWLGTNLYRCARCGGLMRSAGAYNDGKKQGTYRCKDSDHLMIYSAPVDKLVTGYVCERLVKYGSDLIAVPDGAAVLDLRTEANALRARMMELEDMLGDGEIGRVGFARQKERVLSKLDTVNAELATRATSSVLSGVADAPNPGEVFLDPLRTPIARKRSIVDALVTVTILPGKPGRAKKGMQERQLLERVVIERKQTA